VRLGRPLDLCRLLVRLVPEVLRLLDSLLATRVVEEVELGVDLELLPCKKSKDVEEVLVVPVGQCALLGFALDADGLDEERKVVDCGPRMVLV
jgi:hypothetical protein